MVLALFARSADFFGMVPIACMVALSSVILRLMVMSEESPEQKKSIRKAKQEAVEKKRKEHDDIHQRSRKIIRDYFERLAREHKEVHETETE